MNVEINNSSGGTVIVQGDRKDRRKWVKRWHAFGLFFAISNCRIKKRDEREYKGGFTGFRDLKELAFKRQGGACPMCGHSFGYRQMECHHVLPWGRFPEYRMKAENIMMLCHDCHKEIHCNPFLNIRMMRDKAAEIGVDLTSRYSF